VDFHAHPYTRLDRLYMSLRNTARHIVLNPVDLHPIAYLVSRAFLGWVDREAIVAMLRLSNEAMRLYPEYMFDNLKLWYSIHINGLGDLLLPFGSINPGLGSTYVRQKMKWELMQMGLRGVFLSVSLQPVNARDLGTQLMLEYVERNNMILSLSTCTLSLKAPPLPYFSPNRLFNMVEDIMSRYSVIMVISGSSLVDDIQGLLRLMKRFDMIYMDTASIGCALFNDEWIARRVKQVGVDRILFGSENPLVSKDLKCINESPYLNEEDRKLILAENALDVLGRVGYIH